jgi:hypothetical protein
MGKVEKAAPASVTLTAAEIAIKQKLEGLNIANATTADALKRLSKEKSRLALNDPNACVAGVVTSATDPFVVALGQTVTLPTKKAQKKASNISSRSLKSGKKLLFVSTTIGCSVVEPLYGTRGQKSRVESYESSSVIESVVSYQSSQSTETTHKSSVKVGSIDADEDDEDFSLDFGRTLSNSVDDDDDESTLVSKDEKMDSEHEDEEDSDKFLSALKPKSFLFDQGLF